MDIGNLNKEIKQLEILVKKHQDLYYNRTPEISDSEFDRLWEDLRYIDPTNDIFKTIGSDKSADFSKCAHLMKMGSQEKVNNKEDFLSWYRRRGIRKYVVEYKLDGISLELQYEDGKFIKGVTRGDGEVGDVITSNVMKMKNFIPEIQKGFCGGIRAEIVLFKEDFKKYFEPQGYKNPRNMASGLAKQKRGEGCEHLNIIVYDAQVDFETEPFFLSENEKLAWLTRQKFNVVPWFILEYPEEVIKYRNQIIEKRDDLEYDIDGLVIKNNEINLEDMKRARPEYQIAFKWEDEGKETILRNVVFERNGNNYTPVAEFDPIELDGTTVSRASLSNPNKMNELGVYKNCKILVKKAGQIIPQVIKVIE